MEINNKLQELHDFWFESGTGWPTEVELKRWFAGGDELDKELHDRFSDLVDGLYDNQRPFEGSDLALKTAFILATDQLPRNIYRGQAKAFMLDELALATTKNMLDSNEAYQLQPAQRLFCLMPLQHAEDVEVQELSVNEFTKFAESAAKENKDLSGTVDYAKQHYDIVAKFGRFPYRNQALDRKNTEQEDKWLAESDVNFGQGQKKDS